MKDLDRIKKLAGIITESVMAVPSIGHSVPSNQPVSTAASNHTSIGTSLPQLTESSSEFDLTISNPLFNAEDENSPEEIDVTVHYSVSGKYVPARINYTDNDHPAEYPDLDIESVIDEHGNDILHLLSDDVLSHIEDKVWEYVNNQEPEYDDYNDYDRDEFYEGKYESVSCSQCGKKFGSADSGFSSCKEHTGLTPINESAPPGMEDVVLKLKKQYPGNEEKAFATAWSIYNKKHGKTEESPEMGKSSICETDEHTANAMNRFTDLVNNWVEPQEALDVVIRELDEAGVDADVIDSIIDAIKAEYGEEYNEPDDNMSDIDADADALASAGFGTDEDYGDFGSDDMYEEVTEDYDLNNGYDDIKFVKAGDFFPDGADSPVVDKTGTPGARQGDNPEQKKVAVAETHKELVYNYRKFLKEAAKK